jgi:transcription initiation factor TFIIIB Brf1 subunit/transcription initiation factor TFIIB
MTKNNKTGIHNPNVFYMSSGVLPPMTKVDNLYGKYKSQIQELIANYTDQDGQKTQIEYYISELPTIATMLGNSEEIVKKVVDALEKYSGKESAKEPPLLNPPLWPRHLAAVYYFATKDTAERRKQKDIADAFGINPKTLNKGIKDITGLLDGFFQEDSKAQKAL